MYVKVKGNVGVQAQWPIRPARVSSFCSMKQLGVFFPLSLAGMPVHRRVTRSIKCCGTCLYTWVERGTVTVKSQADKPVPFNHYFLCECTIREDKSC